MHLKTKLLLLISTDVNDFGVVRLNEVLSSPPHWSLAVGREPWCSRGLAPNTDKRFSKPSQVSHLFVAGRYRHRNDGVDSFPGLEVVKKCFAMFIVVCKSIHA